MERLTVQTRAKETEKKKKKKEGLGRLHTEERCTLTEWNDENDRKGEMPMAKQLRKCVRCFEKQSETVKQRRRRRRPSQYDILDGNKYVRLFSLPFSVVSVESVRMAIKRSNSISIRISARIHHHHQLLRVLFTSLRTAFDGWIR